MVSPWYRRKKYTRSPTDTIWYHGICGGNHYMKDEKVRQLNTVKAYDIKIGTTAYTMNCNQSNILLKRKENDVKM
jgi:hypothetical protein